MVIGLVTGAVVPLQPIVAQSCNYYAGQAVGGQSLNVDLCSITRASAKSVDFVYYLGQERIQSQANCQDGSWVTFPERQRNRPQSSATQQMLTVVCGYQGRRPSSNNIATVFDPPSNVRTAPNGKVLCAIRERRTIHTYGTVGAWYYTDACGEMGVIHSGQLKFQP
ncbi:hypothetical protein C7B82_17540 [Stenomitos frigidus ULC18]|uniref:Uncharacterized protein n=2 Tax=Stenomitos TaxID=1844270 RepID=A0A2T1E2V7_9CYAN|nr:hypothetical protein C7B82_17540 [Stenomitos frigidus ULC18]